MSLEYPLRPDICRLPNEVWSRIGEEIGLAPLQRLLMAGSKPLAEYLRTLTFRSIRCSFYRLYPQEGDTVSKLAPRLRVFNLLKSVTVTLLFDRLAPEWLYLASQMVNRRYSESDDYLGGILTGVDYSITRMALEQIPWIRNWHLMQGHATLVGTGLSQGDAGYFASLSKMRIVIDTPSRWTSNLVPHSCLWGPTSWIYRPASVASSRIPDVRTLRNSSELAYNQGRANPILKSPVKDEKTEALPPTFAQVNACSSSTYDIDSWTYPLNIHGMNHLVSLEVEDCTDTLSGMVHIDLESASKLSYFTLFFQTRPTRPALIFKITSSSEMRRLTAHNTWFDRASERTKRRPSGSASFGLCTLGIPKISQLSLSGIAWAPYYRIHRRHLSFLEDLHLENCVLGESAWELEWPLRLRKLSLFNTFIACEPNAEMDEWRQVLRTEVPRPVDFVRSFNPMTLPPRLRKLSISNRAQEWSDVPTQESNVDVIRKWNAAALTKIVRKRPRDFSLIIGGGYDAEDMDTPYMLITRTRLLEKSIPCPNLLHLHLQNGSSLTPQSLTYMPKTLETLINTTPQADCMILREQLPMDLSGEWKDTDVFNPSIRGLRKVHVNRIFWTFLIPFDLVKKDVIIDPLFRKKSLKIICLLNWFLRSALHQALRLPKNQYPEQFSGLDTWAMLYMMARYWKEWTFRGKFDCRWILATPIPKEIEGLVWEFNRHNERAQVVERLERHSSAAKEEKKLLKKKGKKFVDKHKEEKKERQNEKGKHKHRVLEAQKPDLVVLDADFVAKKVGDSVTAVLIPAPPIKNPPPGFETFVNFRDVSWNMVLQHLLRLELKEIPGADLRLLQEAKLPKLQHLLVSVDLRVDTTPKERCFFSLDSFHSPLEQLVFYSSDGFLELPTAPERHICTKNLKRLVTCNSMSDCELATFPELRAIAIVPFKLFDRHSPFLQNRHPSYANQEAISSAYFRKYLHLRREAVRQEALRFSPKIKIFSDPSCPKLQKLYKPAVGSAVRAFEPTIASYTDPVHQERLSFNFPNPSTFVFTGVSFSLLSPPSTYSQRKASTRLGNVLERFGRWISTGSLSTPLSSSTGAVGLNTPSKSSLTSSTPFSSSNNPYGSSSTPNLFSANHQLSDSANSLSSANSDSNDSSLSVDPSQQDYIGTGRYTMAPSAELNYLSSSSSSISSMSPMLSKAYSKASMKEIKKDPGYLTISKVLHHAFSTTFQTHFERFTLSPDLSKWEIPDCVHTIDLTDPVDVEASPPKARKICKFNGYHNCPLWHYDSDASLSIDLETLKLPVGLTHLILMAIEPIKAEALLNLLPPSLLLLHIFNQAGDANVAQEFFTQTLRLPPSIQDVYAPHIFILPEPTRITPEWFPATLWRIICSGKAPRHIDLPKSIKLAVIGGRIVLPLGASEDASSLSNNYRSPGKSSI